MFKTNLMKAATFFAVTFTASPLFAGQDIDITIDVDSLYNKNISQIHYHPTDKHGGKKISLWDRSKDPSTGSVKKKISIPEGYTKSLLVFTYTSSENDVKFGCYKPLFPKGTRVVPLVIVTTEEEDDGKEKEWPLQSLTLMVGKDNFISDLNYGTIEMGPTQEAHNSDDEHSSIKEDS